MGLGREKHGGAIVNATIIDVRSSTKNAEMERKPDMRRTRKEKQ